MLWVDIETPTMISISIYVKIFFWRCSKNNMHMCLYIWVCVRVYKCVSVLNFEREKTKFGATLCSSQTKTTCTLLPKATSRSKEDGDIRARIDQTLIYRTWYFLVWKIAVKQAPEPTCLLWSQFAATDTKLPTQEHTTSSVSKCCI